MRFALLLLPCVAMAQTATAPKPATAAKPRAAAPSAGARKTGVTKTGTAAKPAAKPAQEAAPLTDEQKVIYSLGLSIYRSLGQFNLSPEELQIVERAMSDAQAKKPAVNIEEFGPKIQALASERAKAGTAKQKGESTAYLAKCAAEPGAVKTESGLVYTELKAGTGPHPKPTDTVKVHYRGTLIDGTEFDSSYKRNEPATFGLNQVIKCWTEGLQRMQVGGKARLVCPSDIAYGDQGRPSIPGGAALIFEVELLDIVGGQASPGQ